jgi:hypothetical protein
MKRESLFKGRSRRPSRLPTVVPLPLCVARYGTHSGLYYLLGEAVGNAIDDDTARNSSGSPLQDPYEQSPVYDLVHTKVLRWFELQIHRSLVGHEHEYIPRDQIDRFRLRCNIVRYRIPSQLYHLFCHQFLPFLSIEWTSRE